MQCKQLVLRSTGQQLTCCWAQHPVYCPNRNRTRQASRCNSVSGSRVDGWKPTENEQALAPTQAVAAPEVLPASELKFEQQKHKRGAAQHVLQDNAAVQRQSLERLCLLQPPPQGSAAAAAPEDVAATLDAASEASDIAAVRALLQQQEQKAALLEQQLHVAHQQLYKQRNHTKQLVADGLEKDDIIAELRRAVGSQQQQLVGAHSAGSARPRILGPTFGTAVDQEAAATATMAAGNSAVALAAAACVMSADSAWLYDEKWVQPLQVASAPLVRLERAQAPGAVAVVDTEAEGFKPAEAGTATGAQQQPEQQLPQQELQPEQPEVQPEEAMVTFSFRCVTQPGEQLWLVGDGGSLGSWDPAAGAQMQWGEGHIWSATLPFEQGANVAYKAVLQLRDCESKHWRWQAGCDCVLEVHSDGKPLQVMHDFH